MFTGDQLGRGMAKVLAPGLAKRPRSHQKSPRLPTQTSRLNNFSWALGLQKMFAPGPADYPTARQNVQNGTIKTVRVEPWGVIFEHRNVPPPGPYSNFSDLP